MSEMRTEVASLRSEQAKPLLKQVQELVTTFIETVVVINEL